MADVQKAPQQYKQSSRKGKKAWRKNVDVSEVHMGLESAREEKIQGGIISEKPAEELFTLDTTGEDTIKKSYEKKHKPLKADEIIAARASKIPAIDTRKRKSLDEVSESSGKRNKTANYVTHKELQRLKDVGYRGDTGDQSVVKLSQADHDPWAIVPVVEDPRYSFLEKKQAIREPETLRHAPISLAANGKPFAAVKKPGAGKSYNPRFEDWQNLLDKEGKKEIEAEKQRLKEAEEEAERMDKALAEAAKADPVSDEEYESAWESEWEGIQSEGEEQAWLTKKRPERKTPTERAKVNRRKAAERQAKWDAQMKKREEQQKRIKEIAKEVRKREQARLQQTQLLDNHSEDSGEDEVLRRRRFGKNPIPEATLEVVLADELQDSLRALKPEGNLLKDRFRNMLVNGKVEARKKITQPKQPKRHVSEKWSYADWKLR